MKQATRTMHSIHAGASAALPVSHLAIGAYRWCVGNTAPLADVVFTDITKLPARRLTEASP